MKSYLYKTFIFIIIVIGFDRIIGFAFERNYERSTNYNFAKLRYTLNKTTEDVLILGSSRAVNQFDSRVIKEKTGYETYNCGFGGQGLQFSYIQLNETFKRYYPKLIVMDISPNILLDPKSSEKLKILLPYYKQDSLIYNTLIHQDKKEKLKFISSIYPYNSTIASIVKYYNTEFNDSLKGFIPIRRNIDTNNINSLIDKQFSMTEISSDKFNYLNRIILLCQKYQVPILFVICPIYQLNDNLEKLNCQIMNYCQSFDKNVSIVDYSKHPLFLHNPQYFADNMHLNQSGAQLFTSVFASDLINAEKGMINMVIH